MRTTIDLPNKLHRGSKILAAAYGISMKSLITHLITVELNKYIAITDSDFLVEIKDNDIKSLNSKPDEKEKISKRLINSEIKTYDEIDLEVELKKLFT
tara:strand:- start:95 stop:388 length:294 start_codon:yes stop_codon:yes gene_type:complete